MNQDFHSETRSTDAIDTAGNAAANALQRAGEQAQALAQRGATAVQHGTTAVQRGSERLQAKAQQLSSEATSYIQREPLKAVLMAAAGGATLVAVMALLSRARSHR